MILPNTQRNLNGPEENTEAQRDWESKFTEPVSMELGFKADLFTSSSLALSELAMNVCDLYF